MKVSSMCVVSSCIIVLACKWWVLLSSVSAVALSSVVLCIVCGFVKFVVDAKGHKVEAYSSIGLACTFAACMLLCVTVGVLSFA